MSGAAPLNEADQLRLEQLLQEYAWASFHIGDRSQRGVVPDGTFEVTAGQAMSNVLRTVQGEAWWRTAKHIGSMPGFVADVEAVIARGRAAADRADGLAPSPSAETK